MSLLSQILEEIKSRESISININEVEVDSSDPAIDEFNKYIELDNSITTEMDLFKKNIDFFARILTPQNLIRTMIFKGIVESALVTAIQNIEDFNEYLDLVYEDIIFSHRAHIYTQHEYNISGISDSILKIFSNDISKLSSTNFLRLTLHSSNPDPELIKWGIEKGGNLNKIISYLYLYDKKMADLMLQLLLPYFKQIEGNNIIKLAFHCSNPTTDLIDLGLQQGGNLSAAIEQYRSDSYFYRDDSIAYNEVNFDIIYNVLNIEHKKNLDINMFGMLMFKSSIPRIDMIELAFGRSKEINAHIFGRAFEIVKYYKLYKDNFLKLIDGNNMLVLGMMMEIPSIELMNKGIACGGDPNIAVQHLSYLFKGENLKAMEEWYLEHLSGDTFVILSGKLRFDSKTLREEIFELGLAKGGNAVLALSQDIIEPKSYEYDYKITIKFRDKVLAHISDYQEALNCALKFDLLTVAKYIIKNFDLKPNMPVIGMTNKYGEWSHNVHGSMEEGSKMNGIAFLSLKMEDMDNKEFLSIFSGFINPGARDSYPKTMKEFGLEDMDESEMEDEEVAYQKVIDFAIKRGIPYIGFCAGNQHLALYNGGKLHKVSGYDGNNHKAVFNTGSIAYFYTLSTLEQHKLLDSCFMPDVIINNIDTAHSYAVVPHAPGEGVEVGAVSEEGVVQSIATSLRHTAFQFHPEDHYSEILNKKINREKNILDNFFKMVMQQHAAKTYAEKHELPFSQLDEIRSAAEEEVLNRLQQCLAKGKSPASYVYEELAPRFDNYKCPINGAKLNDIFNNHYWETHTNHEL